LLFAGFRFDDLGAAGTGLQAFRTLVRPDMHFDGKLRRSNNATENTQQHILPRSTGLKY
jgi:hypothetical protein